MKEPNVFAAIASPLMSDPNILSILTEATEAEAVATTSLNAGAPKSSCFAPTFVTTNFGIQ